MDAKDIVQLGALGILGVVVITGFSLFKWAVQRWLPEYIKTIRGCSTEIVVSLKNLSENTAAMNCSLNGHDERTSRFDTALVGIEERLDSVQERGDDVQLAIERLCAAQESLIKTISVPRELIEGQQKLTEAILKRIESDTSG